MKFSSEVQTFYVRMNDIETDELTVMTGTRMIWFKDVSFSENYQ